MEKRKYFSSRKRGQITVLVKHSDLKQKDIANRSSDEYKDTEVLMSNFCQHI